MLSCEFVIFEKFRAIDGSQLALQYLRFEEVQSISNILIAHISRQQHHQLEGQ